VTRAMVTPHRKDHQKLLLPCVGRSMAIPIGKISYYILLKLPGFLYASACLS
jgi:hypothetical protein